MGGMRPYLGRPTRQDLTLKLWVEAIEAGTLQKKDKPGSFLLRLNFCPPLSLSGCNSLPSCR
jgi:hypothetical protein